MTTQTMILIFIVGTMAIVAMLIVMSERQEKEYFRKLVDRIAEQEREARQRAADLERIFIAEGQKVPPAMADLRAQLEAAQAELRAVREHDPLNRDLPCDVALPPITVIAKGVSIRTLLTAIERRRGLPDGDDRLTMRLETAVREGYLAGYAIGVTDGTFTEMEPDDRAAMALDRFKDWYLNGESDDDAAA